MLQPLFNRVVVKRAEAVTQTKGGLFIPESAQDKPQEGVVIAVGPGHWTGGVFVPTTVKVGDRVAFGRFSGNEIKLAGEATFVLVETDLIGIVS